jgi:hypothetical protein
MEAQAGLQKMEEQLHSSAIESIGLEPIAFDDCRRCEIPSVIPKKPR